MSDIKETFVEMSRVKFVGNRSVENIQTGCMQRMADAVEKMAVNHDQLIRERNSYQGMYNVAKGTIGIHERSIRSLKGQITKLRKQIAQFQATKDEP